MKNKSKLLSLCLLIFVMAFYTTIFLGSTLSKYVTEEKIEYDGHDHLHYTVNTVFIVKNQEEFFAAVNQGYTYVQLDKNIENPLIVTQRAENLDSDLILDLNGIEIQRNGYEPILNIGEGVRLTIVDTSEEQTGGLYNPVGSVFNIDGGTLTVLAGKFESGPRYSEYYSYNNEILDDRAGSTTKRTRVEGAPQQALVHRRNNAGAFQDIGIHDMPIIKSYPQKTGDIKYNHGNLYFDETVSVTGSYLTITPDTYCYYRTSEDITNVSDDSALADWYYSYYVLPESYTYYAPILKAGDNEDDYVKITIYGYENVIKQAEEKTDPTKYYSAITMKSGVLDVQNGSFHSYFGVDTTACVNALGGTLKIKKGAFSSRTPNATTALNQLPDSISVKEDDTEAFDEKYFNNFKWSTDTTADGKVGNLARKGESHCINNAGDAIVTVSTGEFYTSNNNIITMAAGELTIGGGQFTKRLTNGLVTSDADNTFEMAAIYMTDGLLSVSNANCNILGSNTYAIYSLVSGNDKFNVHNTSFTLTGDTNLVGIYSEHGKVNVSADESASINITGENSCGIWVKNEGAVESINYSYSVVGDNSIGILATSSATGINVKNGSMSITGSSTYGIKSSITGTNNFTVTDVSIEMTGVAATINQTGIYSENGKVIVNATSASGERISTTGANGVGIYVLNGGSVESINYSYELNGDNSIGIFATTSATGINVVNGSMAIVGNTTYGIKSSIPGNDKFNVENLSITMTGGNNQTGIFSEKGKVKVTATSEKIISTSGSTGRGIHVKDKGLVESKNYSYSLTGNDSIGILAEADATRIDVSDGKMTITGDRSFGIKSSISGTTRFNVSNLPITMTNGTGQTGIFSENGRVNISADSSTTISIDGANSKGVHVSTGGSVISVNYSYRLKGTTSHGIYSTAGLVDISGGDITLDSNQSSYGIYAFSNEQINVNVAGATIDVGYAITGNKANNSTNRASVGVFLASNNANSKIMLTNTNIRCYEVGVLVDGGSLDIKSTSTTANDISTRKASSIVVKGGNITFDANCNYNITSSTTRNDNTTNSFTITLPTINENTNATYANTDGVYVSNGNFISNGNVNITHTGLQNNIDAWESYIDVAMTSFAVRVEGGTVTLNKARISNSVGGGLMCNGGNVTLGTADSVRSDITVETTGTDLVTNNAWCPVNRNRADPDGSWERYKTRDGGSAIEIHGGNLTVYEGTYTAAYGDGIYLKTTNDNDRAIVDIYNGSFTGLMTGDRNNQDRSGPAGSYGVKVYGYSLIKIHNGEFNGQAGAACVGGASNYNYTNNTVTIDLNKKAEVYVYRGQFGNTMLPNDGFMIYDNSKVIFGAGGSDIASRNAITCRANLACLSVNWFVYNQNNVPQNQRKSCDVRIYYGTYQNGRFQGWNKGGSSSETYVYNRNSNPSLTSYTYNQNAEYPAAVIYRDSNTPEYYNDN